MRIYKISDFNLFDKYKSLPQGTKSNPRFSVPNDKQYSVGDYYTIPVDVPLSELISVKANAIDKRRYWSVDMAYLKGKELDPIQISVWRNGITELIDGNHRLVAARKLRKDYIQVEFTFPQLAAGYYSLGTKE